MMEWSTEDAATSVVDILNGYEIEASKQGEFTGDKVGEVIRLKASKMLQPLRASHNSADPNQVRVHNEITNFPYWERQAHTRVPDVWDDKVPETSRSRHSQTYEGTHKRKAQDRRMADTDTSKHRKTEAAASWGKHHVRDALVTSESDYSQNSEESRPSMNLTASTHAKGNT